MATKPSIKVTKTFLYLGQTQEWSNRHHFDGIASPTTAQWAALADALKPLERAILPPDNHVTQFTGYDAGSDVPVYTEAVSLAGTTLYGSADRGCPGDTAALVRYSTTQRTSKNHPVYLFNYYHRAFYEDSAGPDVISTLMKSELDALAAAWVAGISVLGTDVKRCGPRGAVAQGHVTEHFLTHRDFRR